MKLEIEKVDNGYIVVLPKNEFNEVSYDKKIVIQEEESDTKDESTIVFQTFSALVGCQSIFSFFRQPALKLA